MPELTISLTRDELSALSEAADDNGLTVQEYARTLLQEGLAQKTDYTPSEDE